MIGFPTTKIVSLVKIANVTHVQTWYAHFTRILNSIHTNFHTLLVIKVIKMHAKIQNQRSNGLRIIPLRNSEELSYFCTCKILYAHYACILHLISLDFLHNDKINYISISLQSFRTN